MIYVNGEPVIGITSDVIRDFESDDVACKEKQKKFKKKIVARKDKEVKEKGLLDDH